MENFKNWLLRLEIGMVPNPDTPEVIPITAVPSYSTDGENLPPTPSSNALRKRAFSRRRMKKK